MSFIDAVYLDLAPSDESVRLKLPASATAIDKALRGSGPLVSRLDEAAGMLSKQLEGINEPGVCLNLALQPNADLLRGHKLHLYAIAVADRVKSISGRQFNCVKVTKVHGGLTTLHVSSTVPAETPSERVTVTLKSGKSYAGIEFARLVYDAALPFRDLAAGSGPLRLAISYVTGFPRTWSKLWQPTLAGLFTPGVPDKTLDVDMSRIVQLEFVHHSVGALIRHEVQIAISVAQA